jgi:hypothetical protein
MVILINLFIQHNGKEGIKKRKEKMKQFIEIR